MPPITPISLIASLCYIFSLFATIRAENITYEIDGNQIIWRPNYPNNADFIHLTGNFKYCDVKTREVVDVNDLCKNRIDSKAKFPDLIQFHSDRRNEFPGIKAKRLYHIVNKEKNLIYGMAYECKLIEMRVILKKS